jgi:hypothetical protein
LAAARTSTNLTAPFAMATRPWRKAPEKDHTEFVHPTLVAPAVLDEQPWTLLYTHPRKQKT